MIRVKRVYEPAEPEDGYRVLVDRLWPRGVSKDKANLDEWAKDISPSTELRQWYGHDPDKWEEFQARYERELDTPEAQATLDQLAERASKGTLTLLYSSRVEDINNATVLQRLLEERAASKE